MLDEKQLTRITPLLKIYNKIELEILQELSQHFLINQEFINSDIWRIQKLEELGVFYQDIVEYINKQTNVSKKAIKMAINDITKDTYNLDKLNKAYKDGKIKVDPNILLTNGTINTIATKQYNSLTGALIDLSEKIKESARREYLNIVEKSALKVEMGTHSYQEAIKESIDTLCQNGLTILEYETIDETGELIGTRKYSIEGAVRREVLTSVRDLSNKINEKVCNDLDCEYVKISEHLDCRIQHFDWQGTIIKRQDLVSITGYGEVDGLGGINCRHYFEPYFGDSRGNDLKKYTKEETEEQYLKTQKQRYYERGIRYWKRKTNAFKDDKELYKQSKSKLNVWLKKYYNYSRENNLKIDYTRIYTT